MIYFVTGASGSGKVARGDAVEWKGCPKAPRLHQFFTAVDREGRQRVAVEIETHGRRRALCAAALPCGFPGATLRGARDSTGATLP